MTNYAKRLEPNLVGELQNRSSSYLQAAESISARLRAPRTRKVDANEPRKRRDQGREVSKISHRSRHAVNGDEGGCSGAPLVGIGDAGAVDAPLAQGRIGLGEESLSHRWSTRILGAGSFELAYFAAAWIWCKMFQ